MMNLFSELKQRNKALWWFGIFNLAVGIICLALMQVDENKVLNVSRWLKPMKFYFSVGIMILTFGWLLHYLDDPKRKKRFTWMLIISMFFENGLIILQSIRGTTSHFNINSSLDIMIFNFMGIFILIFTITCIRICISFFKQKQFNIPETYVWGIRLGILLFIIFSIEGGMMLSMMKHTVGAPDGSPGLPILNWSKEYGDLRAAHFFGIHSLQLLPFFGFYVARSKKQIIIFCLLYFLFLSAVFIQALMGIPFFL